MNATSCICGIKISSAMLVAWHTREQPVYGTRYDHGTWSANSSPEHHGRNKAGLGSACVDSGIWPTAGNFLINDLFIWNSCAKIHYVPSSLCSSVLSNSEVLVKKLSALFVWNHILYSLYFYYPLFNLMLCYLSCSFAFLFRLVYYNHNYNIGAVKCKLLKLLFLIKNTQ